MFSSFIHQQLLIRELKLFKDSYIIYDKGSIFNYEIGAMIYDWIEEMNKDKSYDDRDIDFHITKEEKAVLWKESNKGVLIKLFDNNPERIEYLNKADANQKELHKTQRKEIVIKIYKTMHVEHLLNKLADNGQFIEIENKINLL